MERKLCQSPTAQLVHQDSLLCGRFPIHEKLKEIAGFNSSSSSNMGLHIFCGIPWEISQKVLEFSDSQKIFFQTINRPILQWKIHWNYPRCGKILLKINLASFMLIMRSNKFCSILIVKNIKIDKILQSWQN